MSRCIIPLFDVSDLVVVPRFFPCVHAERAEAFEGELVRQWRLDDRRIADLVRRTEPLLGNKGAFSNGTIPLAIVTTSCSLEDGGFVVLRMASTHLRVVFGFAEPIVVVTFDSQDKPPVSPRVWELREVHHLVVSSGSATEADVRFIREKIPT